MFEGLRKNGYGVILADPPWKFKTFNQDVSKKSAAAHYDLMTREELLAMPVASLAAEDCALVMWATQAQLPEAIDLGRAWGFTYKTMGSWLKLSRTGEKLAFGTGYIYRSCVEPYLFFTRGNPRSDVKNVRNAIIAPQREHSRKPEEMYDVLEEMFQLEYKVELFARTRRPGWDVWGNQTDKFAPVMSEIAAVGI